MDKSLWNNKELVERIEKAGLADRLMNDPAWKLLEEVRDRICERAVEKFAIGTKPDDVTAIIELQTVLRKYKYGSLFKEVETLKYEGEQAFEEAKERGMIPE